jgi:hypothetical protein
MSGQRTWILAAAVTFALMIITLGVGECALRTFAPIYLTGIQSAYEYDDELGYRLKRATHQYLLTDHLEEIRTGELGNVGFEDEFSRYPRLVFALGDSYTQGTGNPSDTAYPFQLDMLLNQDAAGFYSEQFGIVNLGLAAFGTDQSLLTARRYADLIGNPQYVLYLGCDNDFDDDQLFRSGYRHQHLVSGNPRWGGWVEPINWLSGFEVAKRVKLALAKIREARRVARTEATTASPGEARTQSVAERVWPSIAAIVEQARQWDAKIVVSWANPNTASYQWLRAKAAEEGILFADWVPRVESVQERMTALPLGNRHSSGHWRPWANRVIAESYARAMGVWPPAPSSR